MGFFSSIKKLFTNTPAEVTPQAEVDEKQQQLSAPKATSAVNEADMPLPTAEPNLHTTQANSHSVVPASAEPTVQTIAEPEVAAVQAAATSDLPTTMAATPAMPTAAVAAATQPISPENTSPLASPSATQTEMTLALRNADPKLSAWLTIVLQGVTKADDLLWQRITFLLQSLEAPQNEVDSFIEKMGAWIDDMGYENLEDFRSELQYRLALALDLEDEEDEKSRLLIKISEGLAKTREHISHSLNLLFVAGRAIDQQLWDDLEETLIMADVGYESASSLTAKLRRRAEAKGITDATWLRGLMKEVILEEFKPQKRITAINPPEVILMVGVNGVGKTTTVAKLCHRAVLQGKKVLLVAADTFRAAATEQLEIWAKRTGAGFYAKGHGADPAAVAFEAMEIALKEQYDMVFIDTAGRLHTKTNLMEELTKIRRVIGKLHQGAPHRTILILDATTGQNGLSQVKFFDKSCGLDELVITKLDGTAKGGIALAAAMQFAIPISFIGLGEKMEDLRPFDAESFVSALVSE